MNDPKTHGIHHITAIAGDPVENFTFYTNTLGLRMVKKSVNQDATDTYHLFFADAHGSPGTDLTFFPWPKLPPAQEGTGLATEVAFSIPEGSTGFWKERLSAEGVKDIAEAERFGEKALLFADPHGLKLALIETKNPMKVILWDDSPVSKEHQIRGFHTVRLTLSDVKPTHLLLTKIMGFRDVAEENGWKRLESGDGGPGTYVEIKARPDLQPGNWGTGGVHHVAWRVKDVEEELAVRKNIINAGLMPSQKIDRFWFESVYFREPNGVLFELATDGPGFDRDEDLEKLGSTLILPPWLESQREQIEANLPPLEI